MSASVKRAAYTNGNFTGTEAIEKLGRRVLLLTDFKDLRKGTTGSIVDFHSKDESGVDLVVRWNSVNGAEPVYDRLSKSKYQRFISER